MENRLFPYIPFYIARYEKELTSKSSIEDAARDLEYFRNEMIRLYEEKELSDDELIDLKGFVNTIITHITNGNQNEERLVNIMGGTVIETESEKLIRKGKAEGKAEGIIETGLEFGLSEEDILMRLQKKLNISLQKAQDYMDKFAQQTV